MMPHPRSVSGSADGWLVSRRIRCTTAGVRSPLTCSICVTTPATSGAEKDVPRPRLKADAPVAIGTLTPGAATSGLIRPSAVGPTELNVAREESALTAAPGLAAGGADGGVE